MKTSGVLIESIDVKFNVPTDGSRDLKVGGVYIELDRKNKNNRIYPSSIVLPDLERFQRDFISRNRALGELDHNEEGHLNTHLKNAAIKITSMVHDSKNSNIDGISTVLSTPAGNIVKSLIIDDGVELAVSLRAFGSASNGIVNPNYWLIGVDVVHDPSAHEAFLTRLFENRLFESNGSGQLEEVMKSEIIKSKLNRDKKVLEIFNLIFKSN